MLDVFDLAARITLDSGDFELGLESITRQISNFLGESVQTGMSFDKAMSQVAATLGYSTKQLNATKEELEAMPEDQRAAAIAAQESFFALRDFAKEQGRTTVFTATQAAEALNYMALAGYDAKLSMQTLPAVLNLAAAGDLKLGYASDVVTDAQTALGLSTEETFALVEQMAKTASTTNTNVGQLAEAILTIGGTARFINGGTQELTATLGILADNGIKGSEAGIHLRNMLLKLAAPTQKGSDEMIDLIGYLDQLNYGFENLTFDDKKMMDSFQKNKANVIEYLAETGEIHQRYLNDLKESLDNEFDAEIDAWAVHLKDRFQIMEEDAKGRKFAAGEIVFDEHGSLRSIQQIFASISDAMEKGDFAQDATMAAFSDMFNVRDIAAATALLNTSADRWAEVNEAIGSATASVDDFNQNLEESLGTEKFEKFQKLTQEIMGFTADQVETAWRTSGGSVEMFADNLTELTGNTFNITQALELWDIQLDSIQQAMDATQGAAGQMAKTQLDNLAGDMTLLKSATEGAQIAISDALSPTLRELSQFGAKAVSDLTGAFEEGGIEGVFLELGDVLKLGGETIFNALYNIITGADWISIGANVFEIIVDGVGDAIDKFPETLSTFVDKISGFLDETDWVQFGIDLGSSLVNGLITITDEGGELVAKLLGVNWQDLGKNIIKFIIEGLSSTVITIGGKLIELAQGAINDLADAEDGEEVDWGSVGVRILTNISSGIITTGVMLTNTLIAAAADAIDDLTKSDKIQKWVDVGGQLVQGIIDGITFAAQAFIDGAINLADSALQAIKDFLHIQSPSKVFRDEVGKMMALGIGEGFEKNMPIDEMVDSTEDALNAVEELDSPTITAFGDSGIAGLLNNTMGQYNTQPIVINVYARADQNEKDVANEVQRQLIAWDRQRKAAWA